MATWPGSLPSFLVGAKETRQDATVRTEMDAGPAKSRARFTAASRYFDCEVLLDTAAKRATFETFFETTISMGSAEFDHVDPRDGTTQSFRFVGPPSYRHDAPSEGSGSRITKLSMRLEVLP